MRAEHRGSTRGPLVRALVLLVAVAMATGLVAAVPAVSKTPPTLTLGSITLHRCVDDVRAWCGFKPEPLDPFMTGGPMIHVGFVWFPATGTATGTVVADEGGPGFPSTGSASEYRAMYGPLLASRNLLLVDNRGTGRSAAINCPALQHYQGSTVGWAFQQMVGTCGRKLNHTWKGPGGKWIHASDLFATVYAVNDMADIIKSLGVAPVDLYGDSYGTWFVQSFLSRHPALLRSVVLDSAYPMFGGSSWYPSAVWRARLAFRLVCRRDPACRRAAPEGGPWLRFGKLLDRLRSRGPIAGMTVDPNGHPVREHVYIRSLINMIQNAGFDPIGYRELDAAVRAALAGDNAPLLRMTALSDFYDDTTAPDAHFYSDGLYFAVSCAEYSQLFDLKSPVPQRRRQLRVAEHTQPAARRWFQPFTASEWAQTNAYSEAYTACLDWPTPHAAFHVNAQGHLPPLAPAHLPVLVMNGELDSWTSASFKPQLLHQLGPSARFVELPNSVHTSPEGDSTSTASTACGDRILRAFIRAPHHLATLNTSCTRSIPPLHTPGVFPVRLKDSPAATVTSGSAGLPARRAAVVAAQAVGDATMQFYVDENAAGPGLRGGRFVGHGDTVIRFRLQNDHWVRDAAVWGTATWNEVTGTVRANLTVVGAGGARNHFTFEWSQNRPIAWAHMVGPHPATLRFPAP